LLLLVGGAPGCGRACPALGAVGGCWIMLARLLGCATASAGGGSWRWCVCWPPVSEGRGPGIRPPRRAAFLLVGVPALCPVHLSVPVHWRWRRRPAAQRGGPGGHRILRRRRRRLFGKAILRICAQPLTAHDASESHVPTRRRSGPIAFLAWRGHRHLQTRKLAPMVWWWWWGGGDVTGKAGQQGRSPKFRAVT
jgi:hypothetical protein